MGGYRSWEHTLLIIYSRILTCHRLRQPCIRQRGCAKVRVCVVVVVDTISKRGGEGWGWGRGGLAGPKPVGVLEVRVEAPATSLARCSWRCECLLQWVVGVAVGVVVASGC